MTIARSVVLCVAIVSARATALTLDVTTACPNREAVANAIGATVDAALARRPFAFRVGPRGEEEIAAELVDNGGEVVASRSLRGRGVDCDVLAHTVALLAQAWLTELPFRVDELKSMAERTAPATPALAPAASVNSSLSDAGTPSTMVAQPATSIAEQPSAPKVSPVETPKPDPTTLAATPAQSTTPVPSAPPRSATKLPLFLLIRGAALVPVGLYPGSTGIGPDIAVELALGKYLSFGVEGAWLTPLTATDSTAGVTVTIQRQRIGLFGGVTLWRDSPNWLTLALGAEDERAQASAGLAQGVPNTPRSQDAPALTLRVLYERRLVWRLFAFAEMDGAVSLLNEVFTINGTTQIAHLPAATLGFELGVGLRLF